MYVLVVSFSVVLGLLRVVCVVDCVGVIVAVCVLLGCFVTDIRGLFSCVLRMWLLVCGGVWFA